MASRKAKAYEVIQLSRASKLPGGAQGKLLDVVLLVNYPALLTGVCAIWILESGYSEDLEVFIRVETTWYVLNEVCLCWVHIECQCLQFITVATGIVTAYCD